MSCIYIKPLQGNNLTSLLSCLFLTAKRNRLGRNEPSRVPTTQPDIAAGSPAWEALPLEAGIFAVDPSEATRFRRLLLAHPALKIAQVSSRLDEVGWSSLRLLFCDLDGSTPPLLERLASRPPSLDIILLSQEEKWASRAFELDALDFLVKPVAGERLGRTIRRLLRLDWSGPREAEPAPLQVFVPFERGRRLIAMNEICAIHAFGNYTQVVLAGGTTEIVLRSLRRWEETLASARFIRLCRTTLANAARLRRVEMTESSDGALAEMDGVAEKIPVSRRCLPAVRAALTAVRPD